MPATSDANELSLIEPSASQGHTLQIFDDLPIGFVAFALHDRSVAPLVMPGEIIVADINDRHIHPGGIYLRRSVSPDGRARLFVDEAFTQPQRQLAEDQTWYTADAFYFVKHNRPKNAADWPSWAKQNGNVFNMADGPFYPKDGDYWRHMVGTVVGRIVGILSTTSSGKHCAA